MIDINTLSPEERKIVEAQRAYKRKWREANKDKIKEHNRRFYEKLAQNSTNEGDINESKTKV